MEPSTGRWLIIASPTLWIEGKAGSAQGYRNMATGSWKKGTMIFPANHGAYIIYLVYTFSRDASLYHVHVCLPDLLWEFPMISQNTRSYIDQFPI